MNKWLKRIGIALLAVVVLIAAVLAFMIGSTTRRMTRTYDIDPAPLTVTIADADPAVGAHWAEMHCETCHGADLGGGPFFDDPSLGYVDAPNLTAGRGGVGATNTDDDWVRAIRHGVRHDGRSVFIMPSNDFYYLSDADLAGIIAYVKSVPPVDRETRDPNFKPFAKLLYAVGAFGDLLYAETIDHDVRPPAPPVGVTTAYGDYLVNAHGCRSCHGAELTGMQPAEPGAPFAPNLTPGGDLADWTQADFFTTLRTGVTPTGHQLSESMPWQGLGKMTDDEMSAVWLCLESLPALPTTVP